MSFMIQEPGDSDILSELNKAALNARMGGGIFAFATRGGADAFLGLPNIATLAAKEELRILVGTDAITNATTLAYLSDAAHDSKNKKFTV